MYITLSLSSGQSQFSILGWEVMYTYDVPIVEQSAALYCKSGLLWCRVVPMRYFQHENVSCEIFMTQKFPALWYKPCTIHSHTGATKVLTCAENWIAAGSNSGTVNSLDLRNGEFLCTWRPSEFPSAQVRGQRLPLYMQRTNSKGERVLPLALTT